MAKINFDGLKMTIRNENLKTGNVSEHAYFDTKDFEKVFKIPVKPVLENDVEDDLIDGENGEVISNFVLPFDYAKEDVEEYKKFLADAFDRARESKEIKFVEIRKNKNQKTTIIVEQK
jgi:hypothetical protein